MRVLLVAAALVAACGPAPPTDRACDQLAAARCARIDACSPHTIAVAYGDLFACQQRQRAACAAEVAAPGSSASASFQAGCALALPSESCLAWFGNNPPLACIAPPGLEHDGDPCISDAQCRSGTCNRAPQLDDGTCGAPAQSGEPCQTRSCARGLVCSGADPVCVKPGVKDSACDATQICAIGFSCVEGAASCQAAIGVLGGDCDPGALNAPDCDLDQQLVCDPSTRKCVAE